MVQQHFDTVARRYDLANTIMSLGLHRGWKRRAIELLAPRPGQRLADVCGGTADLALMARPGRAADRGGLILVYDLNRAMLEEGRKKARLSPSGAGPAFVRGDALNLALRSGGLDGVLVGFGVRNLADPARGLEEMTRALKPGGRLVCLEFSQPSARWFRTLYDVYSKLMMPAVGRVLTGSWKTYDHLTRSIRNFPDPPELGRIMERAGLRRVRWLRLSAGIATIHLGEKS